MEVVGNAVKIREDVKATDSTQLALKLINQLQWRIASLEKQISETGSLSDALSLALLNASIEAISRKEGWGTSESADGSLSQTEREKVIREFQNTRKKIVCDISRAKRELGYLEGSLQYMVGAIRYLETTAPAVEAGAEA